MHCDSTTHRGSSTYKVHHTPEDESDPVGDGRRLGTLTPKSLLALEAEKGIEAARLADPDINAKDSDIGLLQV